VNDADDCKVRPPLGRRMFMPHVGEGVVLGAGGARREARVRGWCAWCCAVLGAVGACAGVCWVRVLVC
jgi:hypothetical protein